MRERRNRCNGIAEKENGGVAVRSRSIHGAKGRVVVQHTFLRFGAFVEDESAGYSDPLVAFHGAYFHFRITADLFCDVFAFACLDVEFVFEDINGTERSYARLIALNGGKVVSFCGFQKFIDAFHKIFLREKNMDISII